MQNFKMINEDSKKDILGVFRLFDPQKEGFITLQEAGIALRALDLTVPRDELSRLGSVSERNHRKSGMVSENDFVKFAATKSASRKPEEIIRRAFELFEVNGQITFEDLQRKSIEVGETLTDEEIREMINEADTDGDGIVTESDFMRLMGKARILQSM
eukprot:Gregarina_sp_Poly_1__847@NODE_1200_length_4794_cov_193_762217_g811_i1_p5_GENE_NODE_1200_length_4794_cov_193_762217_g811_i1NODE_1200_length_4794_cov_193_762217_g811_i1_p5_ORF_typecomplete_len158_score31_18EFhand_7/PF13499_6/0_00015EFhand_7/PF13499_6/5_1e11EFhand_8/PF13833_6/9EFhand_8/PF13833_6/7_3EFhand_8/PF13833_6/1_6EFhand_8/PF13833_6/3_2e14EFhand_11/PF08976_11/0_67EFhand_11/PF08976_11/0_00015EFhand_1/PF00036_32/9_5e02EFhand_1/PF00036_32/3_5e02EFhand_1/PF00036_32/6_9e02EFhand_1/PF00036_32/62EFh